MAYIGNVPVLKTTEDREEFTVTEATQSIFYTSGYTEGFISVYKNGVRLAAEDYTATDGSTIVLTNAAVTNDIISFEYRNEVTLGVEFGEVKQEILITNTGTTSYTLLDNPIAEYTNVYYNGVLLSTGDYTLNGNVLELTQFTLSLNDVITVIMRKGIEYLEAANSVAEVREEFTVTSNTQSIFSLTNAITSSLTDVYLNGVKLSVLDYIIDTSVTPNTITLTEAAVLNDLISVVSKNSVTATHQITELRQEFIVSNLLETEFTASNRLVPSHTDIFLNGIRLNRADYNIDNYKVTLIDAPNQNDILVIVSRTSLTDATKLGATGGGTDNIFWENDTVINNSYTIPTNKNALTAGPVTVANGVIITVPEGSTWTIV